jgi:hypothetical protein
MSKATWERTSVQNLLQNASSGRYFGRWTVGGKQIWRKLDTDVFSVAKLRLADEGSKIEGLRRSGAAVTSGNGTMRERKPRDRQLNRSGSVETSVRKHLNHRLAPGFLPLCRVQSLQNATRGCGR